MPHPIDIHVGKRLRLRRTILGMSQEAIGNAIGVTFQQVQKYERGANRIGSSRLYEFSKILTVPVSYFFEEMGSGAQTSASSGVSEEALPFAHEKIASRETLEMMRAYYRINDLRVRKRVFDLIKSLADDKPIETASSDGSTFQRKTV
jgi:transcriptional regulator with XRE-family HTH domain